MSTASMDRRRGIARRLGLLALGSVLLLGVMPASATAAAKPYALDLGTRSDYVAQTNLVQCVGASMQMMLNMIEDPLHPYGGSSTWGRSPSLGEALTVKEVGRQFVRRRTGFSTWSTPDLGGKYVLVLPYALDFRALRLEAI